jgi:hypothetical protein
MSTKDRIAIVVSILYFLVPLFAMFTGKPAMVIATLLASLPLLVYWGYRFIKNDISFFKS